MTLADPLAPLRLALGRRVGVVLDTALAVEPVGSLPFNWQQLLTELGVTPLVEPERSAVVRRAGLQRGAPIEEVQGALAAVLSVARRELASAGLDPATAGAAAAWLDQLLPRNVEHYGELARTAPPRSGGMFGFAMATAQAKAAAGSAGAARYALHCPECGGVRLRAEDLVCEYCGGRTSAA